MRNASAYYVFTDDILRQLFGLELRIHIQDEYRQHVTFVETRYIKWKEYCMYLHQQNHFYGVSLFSPSGPTTIVHNSSQYLALMQLITQTRSFEFSDSTEIGEY